MDINGEDLSGSTLERVQLRGARLRGVDLTGATMCAVDLSGVTVRAADVAGLDIDAPWLADGTLVVNGVDVAPLVEAALNERFPGREHRYATDPAGLRAAWAELEGAWAAGVQRAQAMPPGTVDVSVDGEWSFSQTVRHLVMAIDTWLGRGVLGLGLEQAYHPIGQPNSEYATDGYDTGVFSEPSPTFDRVLQVHAERRAMVRDHLAGVTPEQLEQTRPNPWGPEHQVTVRSCFHTILEEGWEHLRFALRDLDALAAQG